MINIQDTFDLQSTIADRLLTSEELLKNLSIKDKENSELISRKMNLQEINLAQFDTKNIPCVSIYFPLADVSSNYLINHGLLRIETYTASRVKAKGLIKEIRQVLKKTFDLHLAGEGEQPCDIKNVYKYRLEYILQTWS